MALSDYLGLVFGKREVWLYQLTVGSSVYHYTSRGGGFTSPIDSPNTDFPAGQVWTGNFVERGEIFQTARAQKSDMWLRLARTDAAAIEVRENPGEVISRVSVWQGFSDDPDSEFRLMFTGRMIDVETDWLVTTMTFDSAVSLGSRSSVAQVVQRLCRHAHYFTNGDGGGCRLDVEDWYQTAEATVALSRTVTVPLAAAQPDGTYLAGLLRYDGFEYLIQSHLGSDLQIENVPAGLAAAIALGTTNVEIAPGCQLTIENCDAFNNTVNFGGFPYMKDSAFDGRSIA